MKQREVGADCSEKRLDTLSIVCAELVAIHSCGTLVVCTKEFGSKWGGLARGLEVQSSIELFLSEF